VKEVKEEKKQLGTWYYYTPRDLQVARVDRQCIVRFCDALSRIVRKVKIVTVNIKLNEYENKKDDLYLLYGIERRVEFVSLKSKIHQDERKRYSKNKTSFTFFTIFVQGVYS